MFGIVVMLAATNALADDTRVVVRFPLSGPLPYIEEERGGQWELACKAPCARSFAAGARLRARAREGGAYGDLVLPAGTQVLLDAEIGDPVVKYTGMTHTVLGVGAAAATAGLVASDEVSIGGAVFMGAASASLLISGIAIWLLGTSTFSVADVAPPATSAATKGAPRWTGTGFSF
jgi:hypothetical protein